MACLSLSTPFILAVQFESIQKLEGHHGEIWALALSHHGNFVVTGSHDKSIRVWEKLDEPVRFMTLKGMFTNLYGMP